MRTTVIIDSLQCETCKSFLIEEIQKVSGVSCVEINLPARSLSYKYRTHNAAEGLRMHLAKVGYPITDDPSIIEKDLSCLDSSLK